MTLFATDHCHGAGPRGCQPTRRKNLGWVYMCFVLVTALLGGCAVTQTRSTTAEKHASANPHCEGSAMPERIILNLTAAPATSQAVTWRTRHPVARAQAQIVPASGLAGFDDGARSVDARSETVTLADDHTVVYHAAVFEGLEPDTMYAYRVGANEAWSEWNQFKTAQDKPSPFTFIYFGDPQEEIRSKCSRVFRAAYKQAPDADFWHFVGDLVDNGDQDEEWEEWFDALGWIPRTTPVIMLPATTSIPTGARSRRRTTGCFHSGDHSSPCPRMGPAVWKKPSMPSIIRGYGW